MAAGVGLDLGNKHQTQEIVAELCRIGDILENKGQAGMEEMLKRMSEKIDEMREEQRRR